MSTKLKAGTATSGAVIDADATGVLELQSGSTPTTGLTVNAVQGVSVTNCLAVGNATPSTSGAGISFPATQSPSTDANTLDDYEEGTWTPTIGGNGNAGSATYSVQGGKYTKVGRLVTASFDVSTTSTLSGATGVGVIRGLPFSAAASGAGLLDAGAGAIGYFNGISGANYTYTTYIDNTSNFIVPVYGTGSTGITYLATGNIVNGTRIAGIITYTIS